jgi:uncharacterized protein with HEPN domain
MSKSYKKSDLYLQQMIEACEKIRSYIKNTSEKEFTTQKESYDAICMQLSHLGEQVNNLLESPDRVIQHFPDDIPWAGLKGLRNQINHNYIAINPSRTWKFASEELEDIEITLKKILKKRFGK